VLRFQDRPTTQRRSPVYAVTLTEKEGMAIENTWLGNSSSVKGVLKATEGHYSTPHETQRTKKLIGAISARPLPRSVSTKRQSLPLEPREKTALTREVSSSTHIHTLSHIFLSYTLFCSPRNLFLLPSPANTSVIYLKSKKVRAWTRRELQLDSPLRRSRRTRAVKTRDSGCLAC
jgi:hypothetical protein